MCLGLPEADGQLLLELLKCGNCLYVCLLDACMIGPRVGLLICIHRHASASFGYIVFAICAPCNPFHRTYALDIPNWKQARCMHVQRVLT
jgi:hypothetical protein